MGVLSNRPLNFGLFVSCATPIPPAGVTGDLASEGTEIETAALYYMELLFKIPSKCG